MSNIPRSFPFRGVVIVADMMKDVEGVLVHKRRDLEQNDEETLGSLRVAIEQLGLDVYHYDGPEALARRADYHAKDVVLSIYGGSISRSRMALVPAVCEAFGLLYVGPDAFGRIMCQDKEISKAVAEKCGLKVAQQRIVRNEEDISSVSDFTLPYVVKPMWEGSSIGIGEENLITARHRGESTIRDMLKTFAQPIMVEAFVAGREVSWCFIEGTPANQLRSLAEIVWGNETDHFDHHLYDAAHKLSHEMSFVKNITAELEPRDAISLEQIVQIVGPLGYGRIDGKFRDGHFVFLEITPDAWLGTSGTFVSGFRDAGFSFEEVIARVLLSTRRAPLGQSTNGSSIQGGI